MIVSVLLTNTLKPLFLIKRPNYPPETPLIYLDLKKMSSYSFYGL